MNGLLCANAFAPGKANAAPNTRPSNMRGHFSRAASRSATLLRQTFSRAAFIAPIPLPFADDLPFVALFLLAKEMPGRKLRLWRCWHARPRVGQGKSLFC